MRRLFVALLALAFVPAPAAAQEEGFLVTFHFDTLLFTFHPGGLAATRASGSGIGVDAQNVKIEGDEVKDLRHCIDGWDYPECSYGDLLRGLYRDGNMDSTVTQDEVDAFERWAALGASQIEKMKRLQEALQQNITVDGLKGETPRVTKIDFRAAEGAVASAQPAYADVTVEVGYTNDKAAKRHEIHVRSIDLEGEGFVYATARWTLADAKWDFEPSETQPESAKAKVTRDGWSSNQAEFETTSDEALRLVVKIPAKKKTPGFEPVLLLGGAALAAVLLRRR